MRWEYELLQATACIGWSMWNQNFDNLGIHLQCEFEYLTSQAKKQRTIFWHKPIVDVLMQYAIVNQQIRWWELTAIVWKINAKTGKTINVHAQTLKLTNGHFHWKWLSKFCVAFRCCDIKAVIAKKMINWLEIEIAFWDFAGRDLLRQQWSYFGATRW